MSAVLNLEGLHVPDWHGVVPLLLASDCIALLSVVRHVICGIGFGFVVVVPILVVFFLIFITLILPCTNFTPAPF